MSDETKFLPEEIARLRGLASKATPRPWGFYDAFEPVNKPGFVNFVRMGTNDATVIEGDLTICRADAKWLHESTYLFPDALDEIEKLRASNDRLKERIAELELRLDAYNGNMMDVLEVENDRLKALVAELQEELRLAQIDNDAMRISTKNMIDIF